MCSKYVNRGFDSDFGQPGQYLSTLVPRSLVANRSERGAPKKLRELREYSNNSLKKSSGLFTAYIATFVCRRVGPSTEQTLKNEDL